MSERRHRTAFDQFETRGAGCPASVTFEREFGSPTKFACGRREQFFQSAPGTRFRADAANQDDLSTRLKHPHKFVERRLRIGYSRDNVLRHYNVERRFGKIQMFCIHHPYPLDMDKPELGDPVPGLT